MKSYISLAFAMAVLAVGLLGCAPAPALHLEHHPPEPIATAGSDSSSPPDSDGRHLFSETLPASDRLDLLLGFWGDSFPVPSGLQGYVFSSGGRFMYYGYVGGNYEKYGGWIGSWKLDGGRIMVRVETYYHWVGTGATDLKSDSVPRMEWQEMGTLNSVVDGFVRDGMYFPVIIHLSMIGAGGMLQDGQDFYRYYDHIDMAKARFRIGRTIRPSGFLRLMAQVN